MKKLIQSIVFSWTLSLFMIAPLVGQVYTEQFNLDPNAIEFSGSNAAKISATRYGSFGACGEVKITNTSDFSNGYQTFNYDFASPIVINSAADAVIKIRMRTASAVPMRLCFRGDAGTGIRNLSCVWAAKETSFTGTITTWQELTFDYSTAGDLNVSGCSATALTFPATINGIAININSGGVNFTNPIYVDYISVGATSPSSGNATCQTDDGSGSPAQPIFIQHFDPVQGNQQAMTGTEISSGNITTARAVESAGANCGQLDVQNAAGNLTTSYSTINYDTMLTLAASDEAVIRIRAKVTNATSVPVRMCFRGDPSTGSTVNLSYVWTREEKMLPGDGNWHELAFYYGYTGDLNNTGGTGTALTYPASIDGIAMAFFTGATAVSNTISVDYISVGNTPTGACSTVVATNTLKPSFNKTGIEIYPNPASESVTLKMTTLDADTKIRIMNALGNVVLEQTINSKEDVLNVSALPSGLYLVSVSKNNQVVATDRLVIK